MRAAAALAVFPLYVSSARAHGHAGVATRTFVDEARGRTLVTEIRYPARVEGRDAPPRRGRFPLVLVAHGLCGSGTFYAYLTAPLARHGFAVAAPAFPGGDVAACSPASRENLTEPGNDLVFIARSFADQAGPLGALVGGGRVGVVGHSLGGLAAVNAAIGDPDVRALVLFAPAAGAAQG